MVSGMAIKPIKKNNISNAVFEQMKQAIFNKEWEPGTKIPSENDLASMFSVSRISIRGAIQKLASLGIVETKHGEGTFVKELTSGLYMNSLIPMLYLEKPDIMFILEFRRIIEVESAKLAALRSDENDIAKLQLLLEKMDASKNDLKKHSEEDLNFHFEIARMTKNPIIENVNLILKDILASVLQDIVAALGYSRGIYYHQKLFEAIKAHDSEKAKQIMNEHIQNTIESMMETLAKSESEENKK
jgi:GntR family transcriptional repressor for pyruvate dehydrogenase complex